MRAAHPREPSDHLLVELAMLASIPFGVYALIVYPLKALALVIEFAASGLF